MDTASLPPQSPPVGYYWVMGMDREPFVAWRQFGLWWRSRKEAMGTGSPTSGGFVVLSERLVPPPLPEGLK